jgi:hypothetical protein
MENIIIVSDPERIKKKQEFKKFKPFDVEQLRIFIRYNIKGKSLKYFIAGGSSSNLNLFIDITFSLF